MINRSLPFFLEDRTGALADSDFDDIYDRLFLRVASAPTPPGGPQDKDARALAIYNTGRRSSSQKAARPAQRAPAVVLEFGTGGALGKISFVGSSIAMPMGQYLRKTSMFGGSLSRKFRGSDGEEYKWAYRSIQDQEWSVSYAALQMPHD
ncbi:hypothetical protein AcV7_007732 [Taiwanofungus camphoratus]|nr:hypothetical protein AcV7_007732 [Antrodia cinnamomea]